MIVLSWAVLALGGVLLAIGFATGVLGWLIAAAAAGPVALVPLGLAIRAGRRGGPDGPNGAGPNGAGADEAGSDDAGPAGAGSDDVA